MTHPVVSIIIPVYNGANFLPEAVDSALNQSFAAREVIVVNDGSDDGGATDAICRSYGERIRYFKKANGGVASALNLALREMRGEYFSWLSHDDVFHPEKTARQLSRIRERSDGTAVCFCDYDLLNQDSGRRGRMDMARVFPSAWLENSVFSVLTTVIHGCALLIHRSHFERVGDFNENLAAMQDHDQWFRLLRGRKHLHLPESLLTVRTHFASGTNTMSCFTRELGATYRHSATSLADEEVRDMFPSPAAFYTRIAALLLSYGLTGDAGAVVARAAAVPPDPDAEGKLRRLHREIAARAGCEREWERLFIFGMGMHGYRLLYDLRARGIAVSGFLDNNPDKWDGEVDGTPCLSPDNPSVREGGSLVLVAVREPEALLRQVAAMRIPCLSRRDVERLLLETPPANPLKGVPA